MKGFPSRREFIKCGSALCAGACHLLPGSLLAASGESEKDDEKFVKEAMFYEKLADKRVRCDLCPRQCEIADLERGYCGVRENRGGTYYTLVFGRAVAVNVDPIEKKPLFHYLPGTQALSIATTGCNIFCKFCQNWNISQARPEDRRAEYLPPEILVKACRRYDSPTIAYTYTEPVVFYEYVHESAKYARENGVGNVVISNGYLLEKPAVEWCKVLSGVKVDLKAFTEKFYKEMCDGRLRPVLDALKVFKREGIWLELVVLLLPGMNDSRDEIRRMSDWVVKELGPDVPMHFSRFHPEYLVKNLPRTPLRTVEQARDTAMECGVKFAYVGNVAPHEYEHTYCPKCKNLLIQRIGYYVRIKGLKDGVCRNCGEKIPGVWKNPEA